MLRIPLPWSNPGGISLWAAAGEVTAAVWSRRDSEEIGECLIGDFEMPRVLAGTFLTPIALSRGKEREEIAMHPTYVPDPDAMRISVPDAMAIVAMQRHALHEKIVRLRTLREAAEAEKDAAKGSLRFAQTEPFRESHR